MFHCLAQISTEQLISLLTQNGPATLLLLWFAFRAEKLSSKLTASVDDLTMAHTVDVLTRHSAPSEAKLNAQEILDRVQTRSPHSPIRRFNIKTETL